MKKIILFLFLFFKLLFINGQQEGVEFKTNQQFYLKGNSILIGNNILSKHHKKELNDLNAFNDLIALKYIDIDNNKNTFSSSQASINLDFKNKSIKYAGLYWSATYKYNIGKRRKGLKKWQFFGNNKRDSSINNILLKLPNTTTYQNINGTILYDSYQTNAFNENKPYLCFAEVTSILQENKTISGNYTVANIKATEGFVSGGSSGGWLLYIIYEDPEETAKYFTTYNGFTEVKRKSPQHITFKGFEPTVIKNSITRLFFAALEGDNKLKSDQIKINYKKPFNLKTKTRKKNNFFNGTITTEDNYTLNRLPASVNTLGFDLLSIKLPNKDYSFFNKNKLNIELSTKKDRFYLFFTALETEINPLSFKKIEQQNRSTVNKDIENEFKKTELEPSTITVQPEQIVITNNPIEQRNELLGHKINQNETSKSNNDKITIIENKNLKTLNIGEIESGYYLITNVFSKTKTRDNWLKKLELKGHLPSYFINPLNNWYYTYFSKSDTYQEAIKTKTQWQTETYLKDIWILKIN